MIGGYLGAHLAIKKGNRWIKRAFEFVTFFALLVVGVFGLFALRERHRALGVFLMPVALGLGLLAGALHARLRDRRPAREHDRHRGVGRERRAIQR